MGLIETDKTGIDTSYFGHSISELRGMKVDDMSTIVGAKYLEVIGATEADVETKCIKVSSIPNKALSQEEIIYFNSSGNTDESYVEEKSSWWQVIADKLDL